MHSRRRPGPIRLVAVNRISLSAARLSGVVAVVEADAGDLVVRAEAIGADALSREARETKPLATRSRATAGEDRQRPL
jgi:hypothetical protein